MTLTELSVRIDAEIGPLTANLSRAEASIRAATAQMAAATAAAASGITGSAGQIGAALQAAGAETAAGAAVAGRGVAGMAGELAAATLPAATLAADLRALATAASAAATAILATGASATTAGTAAAVASAGFLRFGQAAAAPAVAAASFAELAAGINVAAPTARAFGEMTKAINKTGEAAKAAVFSLKSVGKAGKELAKVGKKMTVFATLPAVFGGFLFVQAAKQMDSLERGLTAVTGSAAETQIQLKRLEEIAKLPGLGFQEAVQGSINLQAAGFSAALAERSLLAVGNALATVGKGKVELARVNAQLTQMANKSGGYGQDIRVISESLPQIRQTLISAFGTADTKIISKSGRTGKQVVEAIVAELEKLPRMTGGVQNAFENLSDAWFRAAAVLGESLLPAVIPLVDGLTRMLEKVRSLDGATVRSRLALLGMLAVMGPLTYAAGLLAQVITGLIAKQTALALMAGAKGVLVLALAGLSYWYIKNKLDALDAAGAADKYARSLVGLSSARLLQERAIRVDAFTQERERFQEITGPRLDTDSGRRVAGESRDSPRAQAIRGRLSGLWQEIGKIDEQLKAAYALERAASTPIPLAAKEKNDKGADKLADALSRVNEQLREADRLAMVGLGPTGTLPNGIKDIAERSDALWERVKSLGESIATLGDRAPAAARTLLGQLRAEAEATDAAFQRAADRLDFLTTAVNTKPSRTTPYYTPQIISGGGVDSIRSALGGVLDPAKLAERINVAMQAQQQYWDTDIQNRRRAMMQSIEDARQARAALRSLFPDLIRQIATDIPQVGNFSRGYRTATAAGKAAAPAAGIAAVYMIAIEALGAAVDKLRPAFAALMVPVRIFGEVLGTALIPILKLLFPVFKAVAIAATFVAQIFLKVSGLITEAVGLLVRGIGRLVNKLPGSPGDPLVKAGQAMIDLGTGLQQGAKAMSDAREEIKNLSWEDAMTRAANATDKLTEAMVNAAQGFKLERYRFDATQGRTSTITPPAGPTYSSSNANAPAQSITHSGDVNVTIAVQGGARGFRDFVAEAKRLARANPAMRAWVATLPEAV